MGKLKSLIGKLSRDIATGPDRRRFAEFRSEFAPNLTLGEAIDRFASRNELYAYFHQYFTRHLPPAVRGHRDYFSKQSRGFGEPAFHSMWYLLLREFRPKKLLEIGVFRGQVASLWGLIGKLEGIAPQIHCISPFAAVGDSVSNYPNLDFLKDVLANFHHFGLPEPTYTKALSTDPDALLYLEKEKFDCIYIDGGHDYDVVLSDYQHSVAALNPGGLLVMDDSSLFTDFVPPSFSFAGHPGPSKVARDFAYRELTFVCGIGHQNVFQRPLTRQIAAHGSEGVPRFKDAAFRSE